MSEDKRSPYPSDFGVKGLNDPGSTEAECTTFT